MSTDKFQSGERKFNEFLVSEYLKYGSVDEVYFRNDYHLPVSYAQFQRILDKWGIVKAAGPNSRLTEILSFLTSFAEKNISFESLYKSMPSSFRTSAVTIYRILSYIKEGITRRLATGLIMTPFGDNRRVLVGRDVSTTRLELGKPFGSITIPIGFSRKRDAREDAIRRILQQEVFTDLAIEKRMPEIIPATPKPFMFLDVADIRVEIFEIGLPQKWSNIKTFSSFKLQDFEFIEIDKIDSAKKLFRVGVTEAIEGYKKYLEFKKRNLSFNPLQYKSRLNYHFAEYPDDPFR